MTGAGGHIIADGDAQVGFQIGVLHGNAYVYQAAEGATAEQKFRVAVHYLQGGSPGEARRRIQAVVAEDGLSSAEVGYHWALSVLSGRSLTNLDSGDLHVLGQAFDMAERHASGRWWRCAATVRLIVEALLEFGPDGQPNQAALGHALAQYDGLPDDDRRDIERHLQLILTGVAQDHVESVNAEYVRTQRMAGDRADRVPKFFEPDPAEPVAKTARPAPADATWNPMILGGLLGLAGVGLLLAPVAQANVPATAAVVLLLGGGIYLTVRHGLERAFVGGRRAAMEAEFATGARPGFTAPPGGQASRAFTDTTSDLINAAFTERQPAEPGPRDAYWRDTHGLRTALHGDLVDLYGARGVPASAIRWLILHHADEITRRWHDGSIVDFRQRWRPPTAVHPAFLGGLAAIVAAVALAAATSTTGVLCLLPFAGPMVYFGVRHGLRGGATLFGERRRMAFDAADFTRRWEAERAAHDRWVAWLADRPTDVEMGRWLAFDLSYWRRGVMSEYRLSNRDIFAHLALTEAAPGSRRARDVGGPFRHSAYTVLLFLLTEGGVRQVRARLDFARGAFSAEQRTTFRYDAIGSVRVSEVSVRYDNGQARVVTDEQAHLAPQKLIVRQAFELTLVNSQHIRVLLDGFQDELLDRRWEDADRLAELASDAAGVASALRILEAVAADGRDWIALERQRLRRRAPHDQPLAAPRPRPELPPTTAPFPGHAWPN